MKYLILFTFLFIGCKGEIESTKKVKTKINIENQKENIKIDTVKASKSLAVLKVKLLKFNGGNKYYYSTINVLDILINKTNFNFKDTMQIAYYNWQSGIPPVKECVIYITPWPFGSDVLIDGKWMLISSGIKNEGNSACECE